MAHLTLVVVTREPTLARTPPQLIPVQMVRAHPTRFIFALTSGMKELTPVPTQARTRVQTPLVQTVEQILELTLAVILPSFR